MPLVRAMRIINALEAGTLNGAGLQSLIAADPLRVSELSVMYGMRGQARRIAGSNAAFSAMLSGGNTVLDAIVTNHTLWQEIGSNPAAMAAFNANSVATAKRAAVLAGFNPALHASMGSVVSAAIGSAAALSGAWAYEPFALEVIKSSATMTTVDASSSLRPIVYGGQVGGGYLACIHTVGADRYAVIQAPKAAGEVAGAQWKTTADASTGTTDDNFGLVNANAQNNAQHPLFQWARGLTINGRNDWAPPAYNVIQAIAAKMRPALAENALFKAGGAQVYEASPVYWSATQHPSNTNNAWYADFSSGSVSNNGKSNSYRARVVRMIKL